MRLARAVSISLVLICVAAWSPPVFGQGASVASPLALSGDDAANFSVPPDMELVRSMRLPAYGLTYERYQQYYGPRHAAVWNGEVTLYRDDFGTITTVTGTHYAEIAPANAARLSAAAAGGVVDRDLGAGGERRVDLLINPETGRYFLRVETRRFGSRWVHWINADNGGIITKYNDLKSGYGTGVKGDTKNMPGLTTFHNASGHGATGPHYDLFATDNRQLTYDARNGTLFLYYTTDDHDDWTNVTNNRSSPGQPALVDAQTYANVADDYFLTHHGFNWFSCGYAAMESAVHYSRNYDNAFWDGRFVIYGDGDGSNFREFSGGLDVTAHEYTHGITECTSNLAYTNESGALNESFSDMMGNSAEFFANEPNSTNCVRASGQLSCADWWIGEDIYIPADSVPGFRNMADPREDGDPDHYSERQVGGNDNGGVHTNSGISNHAYYLLVKGGQNAGCGSSASSHVHTLDCNVVVGGIGLLEAERIFFLAFTGLSSNANMSQARDATVAVAKALYATSCQSVADAWQAVGVSGSQVCESSSNTPPTADAKSASTDEDHALDVTLTGSDPEQCQLTFSIVSGPSHGSLSSITNSPCSGHTDSAGVTYTPALDYNGSDSFTYRVNDGSSNSGAATVSLTVKPVNDPPVAADKNASTSEGTAVTVTLSATDVDNCELLFSIVNPPTNGSLGAINDMACSSGVDSATVSYTPGDTFSGSDTFTYRANDGNAFSNEATVTISVNAVGGPTSMHIGDLEGTSSTQGNRWGASVTITVHDQEHLPLAGATVSGTWSRGSSSPGSCTTSAEGQCTISRDSIRRTIRRTTFSVTGVTGPVTYNAGDNHDADGDSDGTSIVVNRPN